MNTINCFYSTNNILSNLIVIAVNHGVLTILCALATLVLVSGNLATQGIIVTTMHCLQIQYIALPDSFIFFIGLDLSGKRKHKFWKIFCAMLI